jgi:hypothetical protein
VLNEAKDVSIKSIGILDHSNMDWKGEININIREKNIYTS